MFTGLVEERGTITAAEKSGDRQTGLSLRLTVRAPLVAKDAEIGDSIAVNGCCLTVVKKSRQTLSFDAGSETLRRTTFSQLAAGDGVNLERSLRFGDRLGGHLVTGHIDGTGSVLQRRDEGDWATITFRVPAALARQMAAKGSVAVDGVSLTLVTVGRNRFSVALIPHTLQNTTLGDVQVGSRVNIETDLLAKYVQRQMANGSQQQPDLQAARVD